MTHLKPRTHQLSACFALLLAVATLFTAACDLGSGGGGGGGDDDPPLSDDATLSALSLSAGALVPLFDSGTLTYEVQVPYATSSVTVTAITTHANASLTIDGAAAVSGSSSAPIDLEVGVIKPVPIVVTAENGSTTQTYTVNITRLGQSAKEITRFAFLAADNAGLDADCEGTIDEGSHTISVQVPYGTSIGSLQPLIFITGEPSSPASGAPQDFSSTVIYTVTAEDSTQQQYWVTVTELPPPQLKGTMRLPAIDSSVLGKIIEIRLSDETTSSSISYLMWTSIGSTQSYSISNPEPGS